MSFGLLRIVPPQIQIIAPTVEMSTIYIPSVFEFITSEMLIHSMASVATHHFKHPLPALTLIIAQGSEDICLKISDQGGGFPASTVPRQWNCTSGIAVARQYARYFGGDIVILPMEGYGSDLFFHLSLKYDNAENIPSVD